MAERKSLSGLTRHGRQMIRLLFRESVNKAFGKYVSIGLREIDCYGFPEKIVYKYQVPPCLCRGRPESINEKQKEGDNQSMTTGGILALFDEFSTFALALEDREYRAGVSVDLNTEIVNPNFKLSPHSEVYVVTKADKLGKTLGFLTMELFASNPNYDPPSSNLKEGSSTPTQKGHQIIARGKHIRYLPHSHPQLKIISRFDWLLGIGLNYHEQTIGKKYKTPIDFVFDSDGSLPPPVPQDSWSKDALTPEYVFQTLLEIEAYKDVTDYHTLVEKHPDFRRSDKWELFTVPVKPTMCNPLGAFHGGVVGLTIEEIGRRYKVSRHGTDITSRLRCMALDVKYLASMKVRSFHLDETL